MSGTDQRKPTSEDAKLGERIRTRRIAADITQTELADALGVTFQQIQKYERGTNRVTFVRLQQIADRLGESINYFAHHKKPLSKIATEMQHLMTDPQSIRLLQAFGKIEDGKHSMLVIHLAEALGGQHG